MDEISARLVLFPQDNHRHHARETRVSALSAQREVYPTSREPQCENVNFFSEVPRLNAEQQRTFPASFVMWVSYICNVYRLLVC